MPTTMGAWPYQVHDAPKSTLAAEPGPAADATRPAAAAMTSAMILGLMTGLPPV
jgi:hypothetical protein